MSQISPVPDSTAAASDSRYDRQLAKILEHATAIFYEKGYEGASIRDLSRASGMSLAGLYYYFESKEKLLYVIQRHLFLSVMDLVRERLERGDRSRATRSGFYTRASRILSRESEIDEGALARR